MRKPHRATGNPRGRPSKLPLDFENQILEAIRRRIDPKTGLAWPDWKGIAPVERETGEKTKNSFHPKD